MAQSGGVRRRKYKDIRFSRKVVLHKNGNECISFSDMNKIESKSEIEFSLSMTQNDVQKKIQETFPYLEHKRFSCAAFKKVDNDHKKFEFLGSRHVWDGETIRRKIKGKSNLYILEEEVVHSTSTCTVTHDSNSTESEDNNADARLNSSASDTGFDEGMDIDHDSTKTASPYVSSNVEPGSHMDTTESEEDIPTSQVDIKAEVSPSSSASDTGFDEFMDLSLIDLSENTEPSNFSGDLPTYPYVDAINTEEDNCVSDIAVHPPSQMFQTSSLDSALENICSDGISDEVYLLDEVQMDLFKVVQDICPTSGSVKGGYQFQISLTEELPDDVKSGVAHFQDVAPVRVQKLNPYTLSGIVPSSKVPQEVPVSVTTDAGQQLGMTLFRYVDEMREMARQLVKDRNLQSLWFAIWLEEFGLLGTDSNISQVLGPLNMQDQDSSVQTKQQQSVKVLQLLVYTAAQTDAQQFLEMIFSTSAGQIVFNSYKDRTPLPEDIARANGHEDVAQFLQDINTRLSKVTSIDVQCDAIDWLELVKAVQNQTSISQDESSKPLKHPCENDDNSSDYFADAETSSCGSIDHDTGWSDISEDKAPVKKWAQLDNEGDKENESIWVSIPVFPLSPFRMDTSSIQEGKGGGSTETNNASETPKAKRTVNTGSSFFESLVTCFWIVILLIVVLILLAKITAPVTWRDLRGEDRENHACKTCPLSGYRTMHQFSSAIGVRNISSVFSWHRRVSCFTESSAKDSVNIEVLMDNEHDVTLLLVPIIVVIVLIVTVGVRFNRKGRRKEEESTPESHTSNNFQCAVTQNQHKEASMIELREERVRSWLASNLDQVEPTSVDTGGGLDSFIRDLPIEDRRFIAERLNGKYHDGNPKKLDLRDVSQDWERAESPTVKLLIALTEKDGITVMKFIKMLTEAGMTLLASQLEEIFTITRQPEEGEGHILGDS